MCFYFLFHENHISITDKDLIICPWNPKVLFMGPTCVAAIQIGRITIHTALGIALGHFETKFPTLDDKTK